MSHKKFGPDRFSRFDVYWIQTNKMTDKPNLYIDKNWPVNTNLRELNIIKIVYLPVIIISTMRVNIKVIMIFA